MNHYQGITVDVDALAVGLVDLTHQMGRNYANALRLGMLPAPLVDLLPGMIRRKIAPTCEASGWSTQEIDRVTRQIAKDVEAGMRRHGDLVV